MEYNWVDTAALSLKGATKDYKQEWEATRYLLAGKMFGMLGTNKNGRPILTVKLPPADGLVLRQKWQDIIPGYYMNKDHWNSVYLNGEVPQALVVQMLQTSYRLLLTSLPKRLQKEIEG